jgi:hypothetical protein
MSCVDLAPLALAEARSAASAHTHAAPTADSHTSTDPSVAPT